MSTTTITGTINGVNNAALANKWITFRLVQLGTDSGATATVAQSVDSVQTDANGDFSINVWNNGDSGKTSVLEITIDGSKAESVIIPTGTATIELWDLIENYQADNGTSEQLPVVSELFLRKSNNLSDISNKLIASQNLDLEVGVDVQAHSAVLDATTASFTVAEESKLSGIEALAEVNDPTTLLDADIGFTVQAHSAVLDATTASFTTAKDTAISTNETNISGNATSIGLNLTAIGINEAAIITTNQNIGAVELEVDINTTNIATNAANIITANEDIQGNTTAIEDNTDAIDLKAPIASPTFTGTVNTSATGIDFNAGNLGGELSWNDTEKTLDLVTGSNSVTIQLGQEVVLYARNTSGATLSDGQVVMISGSQGNNPTIALAQADTVANARKTIGVVTQIIPNNSNGFITLQGKVRGLVLDNGTYTEGDVVYLSSTVAGGLTDIEPDISVELGHVLATSNGGNTNGVLEVQINNNASIHELEQFVNANTAAIALNTAKVTNATHTGDVTGDTALTIAAAAVDIPMLSASGTPDATSFLRGDNTWSVPLSGNTAIEYPYTTDFQSGVSQTRDLSGTLSIASGGYQANANLTSLYIGSKITEIGLDSVQSSANLIDVTIPNSVTVIGDSSFLSCTGLTSIIVPDSVLDIQGSAFAGCTGIASVTIGENVSQIKFGAFSGCNNVGFTEIVIPNSVNTLGSTAFGNCTALTSATLPSNPSFTLLDANTFLGCVALTSIIIPESVTTIGAQALRDCTALGSISCLNTVAPTLVGSDVFLNVLTTTIDVPIGSAGYGVTYGGLTVNYVL